MPEYIERRAHESDAQYQLRCLRIDHDKLRIQVAALDQLLLTRNAAIQRVRNIPEMPIRFTDPETAQTRGTGYNRALADVRAALTEVPDVD